MSKLLFSLSVACYWVGVALAVDFIWSLAKFIGYVPFWTRLWGW